METKKKQLQKIYSRPIRVLVGNAATGHQIELKGSVESNSSFTAEMIMKAGKSIADEADKLLLKMLRDEWSGPSAIEGSWDNENKQIMSIIPARRLVFPTPVSVYNKNGRQLFGRELKNKILRRIEQWNQWEKNGQLQVEKEFHTTDDGKLIEIQFRIAPEKLHPNEVNAEREWAVNNLIGDKENIRIKDEEMAPSSPSHGKGKEVQGRGTKRTYEQNDNTDWENESEEQPAAKKSQTGYSTSQSRESSYSQSCQSQSTQQYSATEQPSQVVDPNKTVTDNNGKGKVIGAVGVAIAIPALLIILFRSLINRRKEKQKQ